MLRYCWNCASDQLGTGEESNGCARLINDQMVELYDRVPLNSGLAGGPALPGFGTSWKRPAFSPPPTAPIGRGVFGTPEAIAFFGLKLSTGQFAKRPTARGVGLVNAYC